MSDTVAERSRMGEAYTERSCIASTSTFLYDVESEWAKEWLDGLPHYLDLENHRKVAESNRVAWMEAVSEPIEWVPNHLHRSGTCFKVESTEMRDACVSSLKHYLNADAVLHEVRHQRSGYHTDLVLARIDPDGLQKRKQAVEGTHPLHDPLQRFRVWWYIKKRGPMPRSKAEEDGRYSDPSKNRKHIEWLLNHGYLAQNSTGALTAITPPKICTLHAVELKLRDWEKALEQAARARRYDGPEWRRTHWKDRYGYADYSWVALDAGAIRPALENADRFREQGVGLLAVAEGGTVMEHIEAEERPRGRYTRDRAYAESQVWNRVDHEESVASDDDADEPSPTSTRQETLVTSSNGRR